MLIYKSVLGTKGRLEIDLNYVYRIPLWNLEWRLSPEWPKATKVRVLDIHELAAGKLNALLERKASRDLFDSHQLLKKWVINPEKLRLAFTVYAAMRKDNWEKMRIENVMFSVKDVRDKLIPVLKDGIIPGTSFPAIKKWTIKLVKECKEALEMVLPFRPNEIDFLNQVQKAGEIRPELISNDSEFCRRVIQHPLLHWRKQKLIQGKL